MKLTVFLFLLSVTFSLNGQIMYTGCSSGIAGPYPFALNMSGTTNDMGIIRNTYLSSLPGPGCSAGVCAFMIEWNSGSSSWELLLSNDGGASFFVLYNNTAASAPNPPGLALGSWNVVNSTCAGQPITTLSGDVQSTLPVNLEYFDLNRLEKGIELNWLSLQEVNNEGFIIEHSLDSKTWETVNFNYSNAHSEEEVKYSFIHEFPSDGVNYYKLSNKDLDGQVGMSLIKSIKWVDNNSQGFTISQNPTYSELRLLMSQDISKVDILIFDQLGRVVLKKKSEGEVVYLDVSHLSKGQYYIRLSTGIKMYNKLFYKL